MSEDEKLDDHMRHGTDYVNLPAHLFPTEKAPIWTPRQETIDDSVPTGPEIRFLKRSQPATTFTQLSRHRYANFQQMDAENRLQSLEMIRPSDNKNLLNVKLRTLQHPRHPRPILPQYRDDYVNTFYDQMGSYVQERSGLYHTANYDPNTLAQAIPELENRQTATDNKQEEDEQPTYAGDDHLNDLLAKAEQIQGRSKPQSFQYRALGDYNGMRARLLDKLSVPRDSGTVDARTQEGNTQFVQRDSIYGQAYNTPKFLQENVLSRQARFDPTRLMSTTYNRDLDRVRNGNSSPMIAKTSRQIDDEQNPTKEDRSGDILVGPLLHPPPYDELYSTKYINEHTNGYSRRTSARVYDSPFKAEHDNTAYQLYQQRPPSPKATSFDPFLSIPAQIPRSAKTAIRLPGPEIVARFVEPNLEPHTTYQHSFKDIAYHEKMPLSQDSFISPERAISGYRLSMKDNDWRFGRMTDGRVKQWKLIDLQDRWTKTQAQRQYHIAHPEAVPYVGDSTIRAKKEILIADTLAKRGMMTVR